MKTKMNDDINVTLEEALDEITNHINNEIREKMRLLNNTNIDSNDSERKFIELEILNLLMPYVIKNNRWSKMVIKVVGIIKATIEALANYYDIEGFFEYTVITDPHSGANRFILYTPSELPTIKFAIAPVLDYQNESIIFVYDIHPTCPTSFRHPILDNDVDKIIRATVMGIICPIDESLEDDEVVQDLISDTKRILFKKDENSEDDEYDD